MKINRLAIDNENLHFTLTQEINDPQFEVSFRLRDNERWVLIERNQEFLVKPEKIANGYQIKLNIKDLLNQFQNVAGKRNVIDIHVKYQSEYEKLTLTNEVMEYIREKQSFNLTPLLNVKYYVINNETMGIQLLANNVKASIKDWNLAGDILKFNINSFINNELVPLNGAELIVNLRSISNTPQTYIEKHVIPIDDAESFLLNANDLTHFILDEKEIFDLMIRYKDQNFSLEVPLNVGEEKISVKKWCNVGLYDLFLVKGKTNNLSIRINQQKSSLDVEEIIIVENVLFLKIKNEGNLFNPHSPLKFQIRSSVEGMNNKDTVVFHEQFFEVDLHNDYINIKVDLAEIFREFASNYKRQFKLFIAAGNHLFKLNKVELSESVVLNKKVFNFKCDDTIVCETSLLDTNPIPIAIMGSCFSRAAFNSTADYFNPNYKRYFNVAFSYFWPSIIGVVSEPLPYDKSMFQDVSEENLFEIEWEFIKNWDTSLKDSGAEYLLLDFFVDAMHGVLQFGPNQFLARNLYTRKTKYYHSTLLKNGESFDSYNPEFFELWTRSFDLFIEKVTKIIPEENLILNLSLLTDKYHDENGEVSSFFNTKMITKAHFAHVNNTWTKMNNYFLSKLPKSKVVDMNRFGYISQYDAPVDLAPCGPHHFESGYYKSIVNELCKVISLSNRLHKQESLTLY